jgi:hypothetical protein
VVDTSRSIQRKHEACNHSSYMASGLHGCIHAAGMHLQGLNAGQGIAACCGLLAGTCAVQFLALC